VRAANVWERAKVPNLRSYCDLLASGTAKLVGPGSEALVKEIPNIADEADKLLPNRASPQVLKGRAYLRLGRPGDALAALQVARRRDERALDDPVALLAWARANARTGRMVDAVEAFRAVLPRASALSPEDRGAAAFEAGMAVMQQGRATLEDSVAMLRQARRDCQDVMQVAAVAALALALDRAGERDEARAVLAEQGRIDPKIFSDDARIGAALSDAGVTEEGLALRAMALELEGGVPAKTAWKRYLDGGGGKSAWTAHASERAGLRAPPLPRSTERVQ
jgi:tetratricopeptide (TPR) repeat protein